VLVGGVAAALVIAAGAVAVSARGSDDQQVTADGTTTTTAPPFVCPVTRPPEPGFSAPKGWPAHPPDGVWYGTADLWTELPGGGLSPSPRKSVWWSAKFPGGREEEQPDIRVEWRRLDDPTEKVPPINGKEPGTNAYTPAEGWFMIAGIDPPGFGCWEVTATYKGHQLSYVYDVPPRFSSHEKRSSVRNWVLLSGRVRFDPVVNCYRLGDQPVVWPYGTSVSADGVVSLSDGTKVHVGDRVSGGGAVAPFERREAWHIPTECFGADRQIAVFNATGPIEVVP
jgi:hypothetical protein